MEHWAPAKKDTLAALADEILHNYPSGFALVAIAGTGSHEFADDLYYALTEAGRSAAIAAEIPPRDESTLYLIAGDVAEDVTRFNYTVWLENGPLDRGSRAVASAIVDVTDPDHPRRVFADSC